jgi:hypothetical protein
MTFARWEPKTGAEFAAFCSSKSSEFAERLEFESAAILSHCVKPGTPPSADSHRAGLVIGLVQSGKTSSFTAVTALARDNGFNLIIIVAGTTKTLQDQTHARIAKDLKLDDLSAITRWTLLKNPSLTNDDGHALRSRIVQHLSAQAADTFDLAVPIVVVMKQHVHLNNLNALLEDIAGLENFTALIVDDEAHMHSPNVAKTRDEESATYARVRTLRSRLPVHTLLQYTATPQANLLAHIADELSPEFVYLLEPGGGYTGGEYFFIDHREAFSRRIPSDETYALDPEEFASHGPPPTLRAAFITYLVSCAADRFWERLDPAHNTMLVHPHSTTDTHATWFNSVRAMRDTITNTLNASENDPDRQQLVNTEMRAAWKDLAATEPDLPSLDELLPRMKFVLDGLQIRLLNSKNNKPVPWSNSRYWVIVGGNIVGVGFTVEGVRTTHMMRSVGIGLADTIQQRGRFFGYKKSYASLCRTWLQDDVEDAFVDYVEHEAELRRSLAEFMQEEKPLQEWKRVFFLDPRFKPTRMAAWKITMDGFKIDRSGWITQRWLSIEPAELALLHDNWDALKPLLALPFMDAPDISGATPNSTHKTASYSLDEVRSTLASMRFPGADAGRFAALRLLLARIAENEKSTATACDVVEIGGLQERSRTADLTSTEVDGTITLHQGRSPGDDPKYAGDAEARNPDRITIQIHNVGLTNSAAVIPDGPLALPFVAVYIPVPLRSHLLVESRNSSTT